MYTFKRYFYSFLREVRLLLEVIVIVAFLKTFIFAFSYVPTESMCNTIVAGDRILVSKLHYGTRLPNTLIRVPLILVRVYRYFFAKDGDLKSLRKPVPYCKWPRLPYYRLPGFSSVQRNDIVVFFAPEKAVGSGDNVDVRMRLVKRFVGLPGDKIEATRGRLLVNGRARSLGNVKLWYQVPAEACNENKVLYFIQKNQIEYCEDPRGDGIIVFLKKEQKDAFERTTGIAKLRRWLKDKSAPIGQGLYVGEFGGNLDEFGKIIVPELGQSIRLTKKNIQKYGHVIAYEQGQQFDDLKPSPFKRYTFQKNYYFAQGDNYYCSQDSRYWGFVPEDHIIGKATYVLFNSGNVLIFDLLALNLNKKRFLLRL